MPFEINPSLASRTLPDKQQTNNSQQRDLQKLRQNCREFEAIYTQQMYKAMRKTIPDGGLFEKDMANDLYREMLDMEMARQTASGKGVGIGEAMYQQLKSRFVTPSD